MRRGLKVTATLAAATMVLAGCGSRPGTSSSRNGGGDNGGDGFKACMVLDTGGVDDRSFNESSYDGMKQAKAANSSLQISYVSSTSQNDYTPNLKAEVSKGCGAIIAVGGLMADSVKTVAKQNPKVKFAEVDAASSGSNVYGMQFNTAQVGFQAGYLAAGMTKTGKVATFGGLAIPPVTIYMDGFWEGVQYYNKKNSKDVAVLGWNEKNQKGGSFAQSFTDQGKGKSISQSFASQGADVVFPVAGQSGLGAGAAAAASGGKLNLIWVDTDGYTSAAQYKKYFISSATKNISKAVQQYVTKAAAGNIPTGNYTGTLDNDGVGLAPFHDFDSKVSSTLKSQLTQVKSDIVSGKISITSPSQPK